MLREVCSPLLSGQLLPHASRYEQLFARLLWPVARRRSCCGAENPAPDRNLQYSFAVHERAVWSLNLKVLEKARIGKLLGSALEARVLLHLGDEALRQRLAALDAAGNGADRLRYAFIVSQVP